jgi:hypothetical protein
MPNYTVSGRVVGSDGAPVVGADITIREITDLTSEPMQKGSAATTDLNGRYSIAWYESTAPSGPWDIFVRASQGQTVVESALISDLESAATVDLIFSTETYGGRSEWERISAKIEPLRGATSVEDIPVSRLEWLARRSDVFPTHLAAYIQAHRLADQRTVKAESCFAFLRGGLPPDLAGLLRAGEASWRAALRHAFSRRILRAPGDGSRAAIDAEIDQEVAAVRDLRATVAVSRPNAGVNHWSLFNTAGINDAEMQQFMTTWAGWSGSLADFWAAIGDPSSLGPDKAADFQFTIQAATLVGNHVPALAQLQALRPGTISSIADLASWDFAEWDTFLSDNSVAAPDEIPGADAVEKRQNYAWALARAIEDSYPTLSLRHRIARDEGLAVAPANTAELVGFFDQNPGFDITKINIARWVADNANAFASASDPAVARSNLELVQRVYRLAPRLGRYDTSKVLLDNGIGSAMDVLAYTRAEFVDTFSGLFLANHHEPQALGGAIWDMASKVGATTKALISTYALGQSKIVPQALEGVGQYALSGNGLEELDTILGNLDYCACEHCRSVFSPAAYLADLLAFLDERKFLDELTQRRPDIPAILLDCANTNTALPYIDLVNEALEATLDGGLDATSKQTTWTSAELLLHPEHLDATVYEGATVTSSIVPWSLPFSLPQLEASVYLSHLGTPRHELMELLDDGSFTSADLSTEALGLPMTTWQIITGQYAGNSSVDGREFYAFADDPGTDNWVTILNGTAPNDEGDVGQLLARAELELAELDELVDLTFIDPNTYSDVDPIYFNYSDSCQLEDAQVINLDVTALDRLHRFERLQRATKIPRRMLNVLVDDLGGVLDADFLTKLVDIRWLRDKLGVEWDELATWWSDLIDARKYDDGPSLYRRRFWAAELGVPGDFRPTDRGNALFGEGDPAPPLTDEHVPVILAATGMSEAEYQLLAAGLDTFSFATLTAYFRTASFARALELNVAELLELLELSGADPFASPAQSRAFVEQHEARLRSGFAMRELDWLLRHPPAYEDEMRFDDEAALAFEQLARTAKVVAAEVAQLQDPKGEAIKANLSSILSADDLDEALKILTKTSGLLEADQGEFVDNHFASFTDPLVARAKLVTGGGEIAKVPDRYTWLLREFVGRRRGEDLAVETLAALHGLTTAACRELVVDVLTGPGGALIEAFVADFATDEELATGLSRDTHASLFSAHDRLHKAAFVVRRFDLRAGTIAWYSDPDKPQWLNLDTLPLSDADPDASYDAWDRLREALSLRALFPEDVHGHRQMAGAESLTEALDVLAAHTGWDVDTSTGLGFIAANLGWADESVFADELALVRLRDIARAVDRLGVSAKSLWSWAHDPLSLTMSAQIKQATRAKYGETQWPKVARPLRDELRERQRDALSAAVQATQGMSAKDIADHLLIDVNMSACMLSSRIKLAISAVQTFVNRAMLGLEEGVDISGEAAERWEWMKSYRVWEANRKVFLYPENWVEPQLRLDKTPEFVAFESALLQGELDEELIESALAGYLEGVDHVAKLEIISTFESVSDLWVVGRTQDTPRQYWVRKREGARWTPWEPISLPIQSDNVVLVVRGVRVYLFWLMREDATKAANNDVDKNTDFDYDRLTIAWSELSSSGWSEPRLSESTLVARRANDDSMGEIPPNEYLLKTVNMSPLVELRAYTVRDAVGASWRFERFLFNLSTKRVTFIGSGETPQGGQHISLLAGYGIDGQRFWTTAYHDDEFIDDDPEEFVPDAWVYQATTWTQGPYKVELLERHKKGYYRAFVLQSDHWYGHKVLAPSFFDDHEHKYLIHANPIGDNAADEGDLVNPGLIGSVVIDGFAGYKAQDQPVPGPQLEVNQVQLIKDGLNLIQPWNKLAPGVEPQLIGLEGVEPNLLPKFESQQLLDEAQDAASANKAAPDEPELDPEPDAIRLTLENFHHPFTGLLVSELNRHGPFGIYAPSNPKLMRQSVVEPYLVEQLEVNTKYVLEPIPVDDFDFSTYGAYAAYNWELFFHAPLLIAAKLTTARRFAEAQRWLHAIFNPLDRIEGPDESNGSGLWRLGRFAEQAKATEQSFLLTMLGISVSGAQQAAALEDFANQVEVWQAHPFEPHAVAQLRPGAYMRAVVMKYLDNLIAWADELFRRDSMESINEATTLYMLAAEILGPRPRQMPAQTSTAKTYTQLAAEGLDAFSNAAQSLENWVYVSPGEAQLLDENALEAGWNAVEMRFWYFCYPPNPKLLGYWDTLEDRLWKIHHCQNIRGITRQLPLFQPPIDPELLVNAVASGASLDSVLGDLAAGLPPYRFRHVLARAKDFCAELRGLGSMLLSALEKRDAEQLSQLRSAQEVSLSSAVREVRVQQIEDANERLESLRWSEKAAAKRIEYYQGLLTSGLLAGEDQHQASLLQAKEMSVQAQGVQALASALGLIPELQVGTGAYTHYGGSQISSGVRSIADMMQLFVTDANYQANKALTEAQYQRREQEWHFQLASAALDQERIGREIAATEVQLAIAKRELVNHDLRIDQAREVDDYLQNRFTNADLYDVMVKQLSDVYYQAYDLAYDLAKRAEAAYRRELAIDGGAAIVTSGYWEAKQRGLLAGERLSQDLRRLDKAYMERNVREYELRKDVSLARIAPSKLRELQETGECIFSIPEVVFDLDHPGHYLRRIRSVSLTIPAVVGVHTSLGAKLTLESHEVCLDAGGAVETSVGGTQMIATSKAIADAGLFQLDFGDERYLPFEYAGAVSTWRLQLPKTLRQFDYRTISDVVISLAYTAREGGDQYRQDAENGLIASFNSLLQAGASQLLAVHDAFPNEWERFLEPAEGAQEQSLTLPVDEDHLPYFALRQGLIVHSVEVALLLEDGVDASGAGSMTLDVGGSQPPLELSPGGDGTYLAGDTGTLNPLEQLGTWTLTRSPGVDPYDPNELDDPDTGWLDRSKIVGMYLLIHYQLST